MSSIVSSQPESSSTQSEQLTLKELRLFLAGASSYDSKVRGSELAKSAIYLLKTLPVAREAVLEYMHNLFDEAVSIHMQKLDVEDSSIAGGATDDSATMEVYGVLSNFIKTNPRAWAPIISAWSLDLLGYLSSKYADKRVAHYSSSLPEVLQIWMACPPTRMLIDLTTQCLSTLINSNPDMCIDALLETSVQHSPHFDWVVAHIGSCFPNTVITRVLACGLKDFISHQELHADAGSAGSIDKKTPKLASVVGILGHLAARHSSNIRQALINLMQESFIENPTREQLATIPFLLQLASMSELLLSAIVSEFSKVLSADVLNKLATLVMKWESAHIPGTGDLLNVVVHLTSQTGTGDIKFLAFLLDIASGEMEFASAVTPQVRSACGLILDKVLLRMQQRVYKGSSEIPLLVSFERHLSDLCMWLEGDAVFKTLWILDIISLICIHGKEKTSIRVLGHLLCNLKKGSNLGYFQKLISEIEVSQPTILNRTFSHLMAELKSKRIAHPVNFIKSMKYLIQVPVIGPRVNEIVCNFTETLALQISSVNFTYSDAIIELLSLTVQPELMMMPAIVKVVSAAVSYFFTVVRYQEHYSTPLKVKCVSACFRLLAAMCSHPTAQHLALRSLLTYVLDDRASVYFGSVAAKSSRTFVEKKQVSLLEENRKFATSLSIPQSHSSILRAGVIGSGLRNPVRLPLVDKQESSLNKQLFLEAVQACCCPSWKNGKPQHIYRAQMIQGMKIVALLMVETISSDVMFNGLPWPDEEFLKVTIERDLHIKSMFDNHPVLWDLLYEVALVHPSLCYCSVLLRAVMAVIMTYWGNSQEKIATNNPKQLQITCRVLEIMSVGQLLPPPLSYIGELIPKLTPFEVFCLLSDVWQYMRDNVPSPALFMVKDPVTGHLYRDFHNNGDGEVCNKKYTERLRMIMIFKIKNCGAMFSRFFKVK